LTKLKNIYKNTDKSSFQRLLKLTFFKRSFQKETYLVVRLLTRARRIGLGTEPAGEDLDHSPPGRTRTIARRGRLGPEPAGEDSDHSPPGRTRTIARRGGLGPGLDRL
jgi:hypothetical protein